ncbi:MAG TPA: FAD-binding oxidoreductase [Sphingomicrobium sp.]
MKTPDILVIGGGIAGLSAASALAAHAKVTVLEAEEAVGYHSSGRSATMLHFALGDPFVRALTLASRPFFDAPPAAFTEVPLGKRRAVLVHARAEEVGALEQLQAGIAPFAELDRVDEAGIREVCPAIRTGEGGSVAGLLDRKGIHLDPHALLQGHVRELRRSGGDIVTGARVRTIERRGSSWEVSTEQGDGFSAPVVVNAAGAWADGIANLAGVAPIGLTPLRRTIITFDAPAGTDVSDWPFARTVTEELYFAPEGGRLFASPMDEVPSDACDAQPDEYEVALAAHRVEQRTTLKVDRIHSRWAGLRTFAPDRHPVAGFDPRAEGFFWLAGQGGFGLQTSPVMAAITRSLITGSSWPIEAIAPQELSPARFLR